MELERKSVNLKLKEDKEGSVEAVFATLEVVDKDADVIRKGAFEQGKPVLLSAYQHESWQGALPIGIATVTEVGNEAIVKGQFNLNMTSGREHYEAVKMAGELQEWSFGFFPTEYEFGEFGESKQEVRYLNKVDVKEISPVLVGAGENTRTLDIKSANMTYANEAIAALATVKQFAARTKSLADLRRGDGRDLSADSMERVEEVLKELEALKDELGAVLKSGEAENPDIQAQLGLLKIKFDMTMSKIKI